MLDLDFEKLKLEKARELAELEEYEKAMEEDSLSESVESTL